MLASANNDRTHGLLRRIQMYDFMLYEMILFLDTHPGCSDALELFRKYKALRDKAYAEYAAEFGPIISEQAASGDRWTWTDGPWPWEREAN